MLIQDIMHREVVVVSPDSGLAEIMRSLQRRGVRHLPVLDQGELVGIISDRDIKSAIASAATSQSGAGLASQLDDLTAADIMARAVVTIAPMFPVEEAARLMVTKRISALPVTEGGRLVGIVSETDLLQVIIRAMGVIEPSSRIDVTLTGEPNALERVVQIVEGAGSTISSIMTLVSPATGSRELAIRVSSINPGPAIKALEARGFAVRDSWRG